jgi:integrase
VKHIKLVDVSYLPKPVVAEFESHLADLTMGMSNRLDTILKHWATTQKIIVKLEMDPKDFYVLRYKIYAYFMNQRYSLDYAGKFLRMLNLWGHFFSRHTNTFFQAVPKPNMNEQQRFIEAREDKVGVRKEAKPLDFSTLKKTKSTFEIAGLLDQWNWLYIALWFGLRPTEVDNLKEKKYWKISFDVKNKVSVLNVFQTKLTSVPKDKRWKPIPIYFDKQKQALKLIENLALWRPLSKTIAKYIGEGFENYSPRKGFTDLMLEKGFSLEDISVFLGHSSIDTTWKHYKNKQTSKLPG